MKKCEKCGKTYDDSMKFCTACGSSLTEVVTEAVSLNKEEAEQSAPAAEVAETSAPAEEATPVAAKAASGFLGKVKAYFAKLPKQTKIVVGVVLAVIVVALIALICSITGKKSYENRKAIQLVYSSESEHSYVYNGLGKKKDLGKKSLSRVAVSSDGTAMVVKNNDSDDFFLLTIKGLKKIANEDAFSFYISANGKTVAYFKDREGSLADLYTFNGSKSKKVTGSVYTDSVIFSPNGKVVAFVKGDEDSSDFADAKAMYAKIGKAPVQIDKASSPVAISDNAKYVYYYKYNDDERVYDLYAKKGNNKKKLIENAGSSVGLICNSKLTEVIYENEGKTYICTGAKKVTKLSSNSLSEFTVPGSVDSYSSIGLMGYANISDMKTLKGSILYINNKLYRLKNNYTLSDAMINFEKVKTATYSADGKVMLYLDDDDVLYKLTLKNGKKKKLRNLEDDDVRRFVLASVDGSSLYFIDGDGRLMFMKGKSKPKKVAEDVSLQTVDVDSNTLYLYIDASGRENDLYATSKGSKPKKVVKDCQSTGINGYGSYPYAAKENSKDDEKTDIYILKGKKAKKVLTY